MTPVTPPGIHTPDWWGLTKSRLQGLRLPPARRDEIALELSEHLEDEFTRLRFTEPPDVAEQRAMQLLDERDALVREIHNAEQEDTVTYFVRLTLCGFATGVTAAVLIAAGFGLTGVTLLGLDAFARVDQVARSNEVLTPITFMVAGVWIMWLYSVMRARWAGGPRTAGLAAVAFVLLGAIVTLGWNAFLPVDIALASAAYAVPAWLLGTLAGARLYDLTERAPAPTLRES
jgi:hypothetical protein